MTGDGEGQLEILHGEEYLKRDRFYPLKKEPVGNGVVLNEMCVKIDGVVNTVELVEEGWYSLRNSNIEIEP